MNGQNDQQSTDYQMNHENQKDHQQSTDDQMNQQSTKQTSLLLPPDCVSGLKELDRSKFEKTIKVNCLKVDTKELKSVLKLVRSYLLKRPKLQPVIKLDDKQSLIHLNPDTSQQLKTDDKFIKLAQDLNIEFEDKEMTLNYDNFLLNEILSSVLSADNLSFSSFSVIGHIIHLNLKDEYDAYKKLIGEVLLDKNPSQSLVLNKLDKIDSTFRFFKFDVLAKRNDDVGTIVQVNENGLKFRMDFAKVYWNPRLSTEHHRIIELLNEQDVVFDVFAGIGPFSIPAAKKKRCRVFANDLNPESYKYLNDNIKLNKVDNLKAFNLDGREFIGDIIKDNLVDDWIKMSKSKESSRKQFHIIMNLPAIAIEFLDAFIGLAVDKLNDPIFFELYKNDKLVMPTVYCYCFHQIDQDKGEMIKRVKNSLNYENLSDVDLCFIRKVAPAKDMYRITFKMPKDVLFTDKSNKRMKVDSS